MNKYAQALHDRASTRGFEVVGVYINAKTKVRMICDKGHRIAILPDGFNHGKGCPECDMRSENARGRLFEAAELRGYKIEGSYVNNRTKISMICPNNHSLYITSAHFAEGYGCPRCSNTCPRQAKDDFYNQALQRGFAVNGSYINTKTKVNMVCPFHHTVSITPSHFKLGKGCPQCASSGYKKYKTGYLYFLQATNPKFVKIGISNNPKRRLKKLKCDTPFEFIHHSMFVGSGEDVQRIEACLHSLTESANLSGFDGATEWRIVDDLDFINYLTLTGLQFLST